MQSTIQALFEKQNPKNLKTQDDIFQKPQKCKIIIQLQIIPKREIRKQNPNLKTLTPNHINNLQWINKRQEIPK